MIPFKEFNVIGSRVINLQKPYKEDLEWLYITKNLKRDEVANIYSKSVNTVKYWLKKWDIKKPDKRPVKKELIRLYIEENHSIEEITIIFDVSQPTVQKWLKEYNIKKPTELIVKKREKTCFERHGVEHPLQAEEFMEKSKKTCFKNYGVEICSQSKEIQEKTRKTMVERHGVEYPLQSPEIQEKTRKTCLKRFGVKHPAQYKEIQEKMEHTCFENLGVKNPSQSKEVQEKKEKTFLKKYGGHPMKNEEIKVKHKEKIIKNHGVEHSSQIHIKNYDIWNNEILFQEWIMETYNKLGRKLTSGDLNNYFNLSKKSETAPGRLRQLPEEFNKYYKIGGSYFEPVVEDWIKQNITSVYERNKRYDFMLNSNGNRMQLDFFFPELKFAVEVNDNWSHNPEFRIKQLKMTPEEALNYEQTKTDLCKAQGIKLIHLWEDDFDNIDTVLKPILDADKK